MSTGTPKATEICVALTSKARRITHAPTFALRRVQRRRPRKLLMVSAGRRFVCWFSFAPIDELLTYGHATAHQ